MASMHFMALPPAGQESRYKAGRQWVEARVSDRFAGKQLRRNVRNNGVTIRS
jgi:hypothetical protein